MKHLLYDEVHDVVLVYLLRMDFRKNKVALIVRKRDGSRLLSFYLKIPHSRLVKVWKLTFKKQESLSDVLLTDDAAELRNLLSSWQALQDSHF